MIKVLVVEDSLVVREFLIQILNSDPEIEVVGIACDGEEAVKAVKEKAPDIITMDIHMPKLNGFDATRKIMENNPTPIIIVSGSSTSEEIATTFHALESGALVVSRRPAGIGHPDYEATAKELIQTVKLMSEVKVIRRWPRILKKIADSQASLIPPVNLKEIEPDIQLVAIGASTGGPIALQKIISQLPKDFPVPVVIVQHISEGFIYGFTEWLNGSSSVPIHVAENDEYLLPGHVYIAPDGHQIAVTGGNRVVLRQEKPENGLRPSVSYLFRSVAKSFGHRAIGILLTGMGKDGAKELKQMKEGGAITIVQEKDSCVIFGMPGEAIKLDAATYVFPPEKIAEALISLVKRAAK
jgi:two-component system chemotaxis response regulator CheB